MKFKSFPFGYFALIGISLFGIDADIFYIIPSAQGQTFCR